MPWRAGANLAGVNPTLLALLQRAAQNSPYIVQPTSGVRAPGSDVLKGSAHHTGQATDVELIDPQTGKVIPNYQNAASAKAYQDFANQVYGSATPDQQRQLRWGGYFWNGGPGHYGNMDLMHFDYGTGQPMGAGSFEKGFAPNQIAAYKLPGSGTPAGQVMVASNAPVAPPGGAVAAAPAPVRAGPMSSMESYIRQSAQARGIDPDIAVKVAMSEGGLTDPTRQSDYVNKGVRETSYGPFQLRIGGGLGDKALSAGIDPRKPEDAYKAVDFALDQVKQGGWGPWMGAKKLGITGMTGVGGAPPTYGSSGGGPGGGTRTGEAPTPTNMAGPDVTATYGSSPGGPGGGTRTGQAPPPLAAQPTAVAGNFPPAPAPPPQQKDWRDMLASAMAGMGKGFAALSQPGPRPDMTPQVSPSVALPAQPIIDPTVANNQRQQMAMALARLNSGQLNA